MFQSAEKINAVLWGFTNVNHLAFEMDPETFEYSLRLQLQRDSGEAVTLECGGVANLDLRQFGGGLTQIMLLQATDIRDHQLDKLAFRFVDLEHQRIAFMCATARVEVPCSA